MVSGTCLCDPCDHQSVMVIALIDASIGCKGRTTYVVDSVILDRGGEVERVSDDDEVVDWLMRLIDA